MHARLQTSLSTPQVSKGILPPTTVLLYCACVFVMYVHLSLYSSVWMDYSSQMMLPLTITHRLKFPDLLKPPLNLQWELK